MPRPRPLHPAIDALYTTVHQVLATARQQTYRAVNGTMVQAYWQVGRLIVEHEQDGRRRAGYGEVLLEALANRLTREFGRGFDVTNLRKMRQFYSSFQIRDTARLESPSPSSVTSRKRDAPRLVLAHDRPEAVATLSWSHYRLLMKLTDPVARAWYMREAVAQHWSTRQLERQIAVLYYERLLASRRKAPVRAEARRRISVLEPEQFIRDPMVLDFMGLQDYPALRESVLEQAIIDNLQAFLLELGKGFSFVARQKRLRFDEEDFYIDLVFYNYLLKCFVLIDLKVGKLTHQDIGQMDSYVRLFDAHGRPTGDNPTIGLILCSQKNTTIARYSVLNDAKQIFAARYLQYLPSEDELRRHIEQNRRLLEGRWEYHA